jgi:ribosomal protein S12 methylthiotransferase
MISLGCAKNLVDAEVMLGHLAERGAELVRDEQDADVVIVNTCGFIDSAKQESVDAILEVAARRRAGTLKRLVVAGCMVQRYADELRAEIPEVDAFIGLDELERVGEAVLGELAADRIPDQHGALRLYDHTAPRVLATGGVHAYVKVAEGCDNPCTFCHIPAMRGRFRSRSVASLVAEAQRLEAAGVTEIVLVAQDTTRYGEDLGLGRSGLRRLLEALLAGTTLPWIRFLYAYPATLDEGIFALMRAEPRLLPYLDIPLQHASRTVLKAMKRGGDARSYRALIARARSAVPGLAVRTTFIVGFPGEGEEEFAELQRFVDEVGFDHLGVFAYSWQPENPGAELGDPVPQRVKAKRLRALMRQQERISRERHRALRGTRVTALVEGASPESELLLQGRLAGQAPEVDGRVLFSEGTARAGELVTAVIRKTYAFDLVADIVGVVRPAPERRRLVLPSLPAVPGEPAGDRGGAAARPLLPVLSAAAPAGAAAAAGVGRPGPRHE